VGGEPCSLVLEGPGEAGAMPRPGYRGHHHPVLAAFHPRCLSLEVGHHIPEVQAAPSSVAITPVVTGTASSTEAPSVAASNLDVSNWDTLPNVRRWLNSASKAGSLPPIPIEGMLEAALLVLLAESPKYGYELWQEVRSGLLVAGRVHVGQVYETLGRLAGGGFVEESSPAIADEKRRYSITPAGRGCLRRWLAALAVPRERLDALMERASRLPGAGKHAARPASRHLVEPAGALMGRHHIGQAPALHQRHLLGGSKS
jgi:DNA-binding PadR family transcriptional regulator